MVLEREYRSIDTALRSINVDVETRVYRADTSRRRKVGEIERAEKLMSRMEITEMKREKRNKNIRR